MPSVTTSMAPLPPGATSGQEVQTEDDALKRALAKRLEMLLNENEVVREKVRFLEEAVQIVTKELEQKKLLLSQFLGVEGSGSSKAMGLGSEMKHHTDATMLVEVATKEELTALLRSLISDKFSLQAQVDDLGRRLARS